MAEKVRVAVTDDQGNVLGLMLDLSLLRDTKGAAGLDEVMRRLYREHYGKGRGFTTDDLGFAVGLWQIKHHRDDSFGSTR